jgi:hypothetical protein
MMIHKDVVLLQNLMDLKKDLQSSCSETCPLSCDANQIISLKAEDVSDIEEKKDPVPFIYSGIKPEHEVTLHLNSTSFLS